MFIEFDFKEDISLFFLYIVCFYNQTCIQVTLFPQTTNDNIKTRILTSSLNPLQNYESNEYFEGNMVSV